VGEEAVKKKLVVSVLTLAGSIVSAQSADLDSLKDPLPDNLSWHGVTVYGTIDVGYSYQTNGLGASGSNYAPAAYSLFGLQYAKGSNSTILNNNISQSLIGAKIEEGIGFGTTAIGKIETYFDPAWGEIPDMCKALIEAATNGYKTAAGDGRVCGQTFGGEVYAGLSNAKYGTLTIGRQAALASEFTGKYDPNSRSYAFSAFGATGTFSSGSGATAASLWDSSVKYKIEFGPVRIGVMYTEGSEDSSLHGNAAGATAGFSYKGLSVDGTYTNQHGAVIIPAGIAGTTNQLVYFMTNDEAWHIGAKYSFDLGGGYKDWEPAAKLTVMGGYIHIDATDGGADTGGTTQGGYILAKDALRLTSTRTLETTWGGAKYEAGAWTVTGAYYHTAQDNYTISALKSGGCSVNPGVCAGSFNTVGGVIDYAFNKHFDVYLGAEWSQLTGGFDHNTTTGAAYLSTNNTSVSTGVRLRF
jgi:predicted porin